MSEHNSGTGCGMQFLLTLLLAASVALNIALLSGCSSCSCKGCGIFNALQGNHCECKANATSSRKMVYDATDDLLEISSRLGVETLSNNAYDIASAIKTKLYVDAEAKGFPKDILTAEQFEKIKDRLPEDKASILVEYQKFIKSLDGKRYIIVP